MRAVLISTYEMGRQPFGLASAQAWLRRAGWEVEARDLSRDSLSPAEVAGAALLGFYLPMHTATRLALRLLPALRAAAPGAHLCAFGLYAAINRELLESAGVATVLGPEFEAGLAALADALARKLPASVHHGPEPLPRLAWMVPDRTGLAPLDRYAALEGGGAGPRITGYTEASRGCKHHCRHCPLVPVYNGQFRVVTAEVVLTDIRQQVARGAAHITFGDPDFFNGPTHARRLIAALHREFPQLSYDVTIKVEHLLRHHELLPELRETGCVLVTTAVESFDDSILARLEKHHTRADILTALQLTRAAGLALNPTFVAFTPWTTPASFFEMCAAIDELDLVEQVAPVQYGIRLLIPSGSRLLELPDAAEWLGPWDAEALSYRWHALDPAADRLAERAQALVVEASQARRSRSDTFQQVWELAAAAAASAGLPRHPPAAPARATVPYLNEPWFC
ncbi:MAG: CUAEP/CCAEP-tail radical SAM (seleno)protein [Terriglobales bacterium]